MEFLSGDIITLIVLAVILLGILGLLRLMFKLTASVFRLGCALVFLIVAGVAAYLFLV
jgi:hypothetical protein